MEFDQNRMRKSFALIFEEGRPVDVDKIIEVTARIPSDYVSAVKKQGKNSVLYYHAPWELPSVEELLDGKGWTCYFPEVEVVTVTE